MFNAVVYVSGYLFILFVAVCLACGLYYLAGTRCGSQALRLPCTLPAAPCSAPRHCLAPPLLVAELVDGPSTAWHTA